METYSLLRQFADSWMLLAMTLFFLGVIFWAFRPGSRTAHDEAANLIFRDGERPAAHRAGHPATGAATDDPETKK